MRASSAIVQSVSDFAIREINALERRIVKAEDDADAMLWEQAGVVVAQLANGMSLRDLAAQWLNVKGEPYSHIHVYRTRETFDRYFKVTVELRPRFRDAYNAIANAAAKPKKPHRDSEPITWNGDLRDSHATKQVNLIAYTASFLLSGVVSCEPDEDVDIDGLPDELVEALDTVVYARLDPACIPAWVTTFRQTARDLLQFAARLELEAERRATGLPVSGHLSESCPNLSGGTTDGHTGQTTPS